MRPSNKSRNRNKNNNRRGSASNNINRVFESAGPEGRVRGTPQQIIDKYLSLTYDCQLSGDRVAAENFQQHAEHYSRLLIEAQKEIAEKQNEQSSVATNDKSKIQLTDTSLTDTALESGHTDRSEDKVVKFDKSLEKKIINTELPDNKPQLEDRPKARKVSKKLSSTDSKTVKV